MGANRPEGRFLCFQAGFLRASLDAMDKLNSGPVIEPARPADVTAMAALLKAAGLPSKDFVAHLAHFLVAREGGEVVGVVGCERHGPDALLRSLVVAPARRGGGLGDKLVRQLTVAAIRSGVEDFYLLTTTAEDFFRARGFVAVPRDRVPAGLAATKEFRGSLCPASAVCLTRPARG